jgi:hypothetical protein
VKEPSVLNAGYTSLVANLSVATFWNITPGLSEIYSGADKSLARSGREKSNVSVIIG